MKRFLHLSFNFDFALYYQIIMDIGTLNSKKTCQQNDLPIEIVKEN